MYRVGAGVGAKIRRLRLAGQLAERPSGAHMVEVRRAPFDERGVVDDGAQRPGVLDELIARGEFARSAFPLAKVLAPAASSFASA
jgi:hypothetical protein